MIITYRSNPIAQMGIAHKYDKEGNPVPGPYNPPPGYRITRTNPHNGYTPGRWLIQKWSTEVGRWFDVGDPYPDEWAAYRALCAHVAEVTA